MTTTTTNTQAASTFIDGIAHLDNALTDLTEGYHIHITALYPSEWEAEFERLATAASQWTNLDLAPIARGLAQAVKDSKEGGDFGRAAFHAICEKLQGDYVTDKKDKEAYKKSQARKASNSVAWSRAKSKSQKKETGRPAGKPSRKPTAKEQAQAILAKLEGHDDVRAELIKLILEA